MSEHRIDCVGEKCPRCASPKPHLHPAVQLGGEVQPCGDPWHESTRLGREALDDPMIRAVLRASRAYAEANLNAALDATSEKEKADG